MAALSVGRQASPPTRLCIEYRNGIGPDRIACDRKVMRKPASGLLLIGFLLCRAGIAGAEDSHRFEVFGSIGGSGYGEIFGGSGTAANLGAGFGIRPVSETHRIAHGIGLEFEFDTESGRTFSRGFFSPAVPNGIGDKSYTLVTCCITLATDEWSLTF